LHSAEKLDVEPLPSNKGMLLILSLIFFVIGIWLLLSSAGTLERSAADVIVFIVGVCLIALTLVFLATPFIMGNLMTPTKIVIRYGILFRLELPLGEIAEAKNVISGGKYPLILGIGVRYDAKKRQLRVLRSNIGKVTIRLKRELVSGGIIKWRIEEILLDVADPDRLIDRIVKTATG